MDLFVVVQSCLTLWNSMDCSNLGSSVLHSLLEFAQTHVHWVGDTIQPSHPLQPPWWEFRILQFHHFPLLSFYQKLATFSVPLGPFLLRDNLPRTIPRGSQSRAGFVAFFPSTHPSWWVLWGDFEPVCSCCCFALQDWSLSLPSFECGLCWAWHYRSKSLNAFRKIQAQSQTRRAAGAGCKKPKGRQKQAVSFRLSEGMAITECVPTLPPTPVTSEQLRRLAQVARFPTTNPPPTGVFEPLSPFGSHHFLLDTVTF